jgi:hypothetical protein
MIPQDSVLMQVSLSIKMADHVKKRSKSMKENNGPKSTRCHSYDSYLRIMMLKYAEQVNNGKSVDSDGF